MMQGIICFKSSRHYFQSKALPGNSRAALYAGLETAFSLVFNINGQLAGICFHQPEKAAETGR